MTKEILYKGGKIKLPQSLKNYDKKITVRFLPCCIDGFNWVFENEEDFIKIKISKKGEQLVNS